MTSVGQVANHVASALMTLAVLIVLVGGIAFFVARRFGGNSRTKRRIIFTLVAGAGLLCSVTYTVLQLQG